MAGERILIVDDDRTTANVMQLYLEKFGFVVLDIACSGAEAVDRTRNLKPDLILMDIHLGKGLDGIDTAEVIMKNFHVPVVYVTSHSDDTTLQRAQASNAYGYINKPLRETDLKTTVRLALEKNKNQPESKPAPSVNEALHKVYNLTPAESRVVSQLIINPDVEVASETLHISVSTLRTHLKHIYRKTETKDKTELIHRIITGPVAMLADSK